MKSMPMETRLIGRSEIRASRIGLGCATFGREIGEDECFAIMDFAVEHGITLFDTAEAYGGGQAHQARRQKLGRDEQREVSTEFHSSEKIIGRWLRSRGQRKQIVLVSKITTDLTPEHIRLALEHSLERLQTDYLDLYLFHRFDLQNSLGESLSAMHDAERSGAIRAAGCSNFSAAQISQALEVSERLGIGRLQVSETIFNLIDRGAESDILPLCREQQVGFFGYSPIAAGFLTGKYPRSGNRSLSGTRFDVIPDYENLYFREESFDLVEKLQSVSRRTGISSVQLATAWALSHPDVTSILVGARSTAHLQKALEASRLASGAMPSL
jgi:aryl-alcohol dehydrogenase-like predicted oxidoreductase